MVLWKNPHRCLSRLKGELLQIHLPLPKRQPSLLSATAGYQNLWEETALSAKAEIAKAALGRHRPLSGCSLPTQQHPHSASITTAAAAPSESRMI